MVGLTIEQMLRLCYMGWAIIIIGAIADIGPCREAVLDLPSTLFKMILTCMGLGLILIPTLIILAESIRFYRLPRDEKEEAMMDFLLILDHFLSPIVEFTFVPLFLFYCVYYACKGVPIAPIYYLTIPYLFMLAPAMILYEIEHRRGIEAKKHMEQIANTLTAHLKEYEDDISNSDKAFALLQEMMFDYGGEVCLADEIMAYAHRRHHFLDWIHLKGYDHDAEYRMILHTCRPFDNPYKPEPWKSVL